jgi:ADP-ribose pyrophosphatase YjhB (NUDIX family)
MITCKFEDNSDAALRHVCVDTMVFNDKGQLLLVKRTGKLIEGGKWGLTGGFVDRDETLVQAVEREAMEETGWKVKDVTMLRVKDSPDRPFDADRQNIAFTYYCTATEKTGEKDWESDDVQWFDLTALPAREQIAFDQAEDIDLYKETVAGSRK